ncbi:MAG TPA: hypothetical protein PLL33_11745 [Paracoccus sp. (in: a-proteobacteria)]|nr:hypothetical protein [Paracoccus sp. (in: a-proteobacteria)]
MRRRPGSRRGGCGASLRNVNGSFFDLRAERHRHTAAEILTAPSDDWGGRAAVHWLGRLAQDTGHDPGAGHLVTVAGVRDAIYGRT